MTQKGKDVSALKEVSPEDKTVSLLATLTCPPGPLEDLEARGER